MTSEVIYSKIPVGDAIETPVPWYIPVTGLQFITTPECRFVVQIIEKEDGSKIERKWEIIKIENVLEKE